MPFYEYECSSCKFYTEVMQKITDAPLKKCPSCGKSTLKKLLSVPNFRLKGGGWYETDFKSEKETKRNLAEGEKSEAKDSAAKEGDAKEAKPAGAADARTTQSKPADVKGPASKPAAESSSTRKSVAVSRKTAPQRTAKGRGARPGARGKARTSRKARR
jgi:putative FmdB family regulatory protein